MGAIKEVVVPDIGDFSDVEVIEVLVKPGDRIAMEQSLLTLESDKATMEIPSSAAGVVKEVKVKVGDKVSQGTPVLVVEEEAGAAATEPEAPRAAAPQTTPTPAGAAGGTTTVRVPDIGDFKDVDVIEILVKPGDRIEKEQSLVTLESDKATMEVPSSDAGVVKSILLKAGDKVSKGAPILELEAATAPRAAAAEPKPPTPAAPVQPVEEGPVEVVRAPSTPVHRTPPVHPDAADAAGFKPHASPSVRKFARELGVDLSHIRGSGPKNRILHSDVQAYVKGVMGRGPAAAAPAAGGIGLGLPAWPQVDFAKFGEIETVPMSRIRKISGPSLSRNWVTIPHVTNHDDADVTDLEAFRVQLNRENEKSGVKVTMLAFLIKACVAALRKFPEFNGSLGPDGESIVLKKYFHIGFAADTPNGLVVPNIKDADKKGVFEIATETAELAKLAREGKLKPGDMQGGTFSVSSLGGIGGTYFTPIINAPEVAILGVCRAAMRPVWDGAEFKPRLILPLSLSWDHRVVDGAAAARFNAYLAQLLADFRRVML